jgi:beta-lactamase class A
MVGLGWGTNSMYRAFKLLSALLAGLFLGAGASATVPEMPPFQGRAEQLVPFLNGEAKPEDMFTPRFLSQIPVAQLDTITAGARAQYGRAQSVTVAEQPELHRGTVRVRMEKATLRILLVIQPDAPHQIEGLLIEAADQHDDSMAAVLAELGALPGSVSFAVARLGDGKPEMLYQLNGGTPGAIGSEFKLFLLAELSRQIAAGERKWTDVVTLDRRSHPSGILQDWPEGSPLTLHTLATLMISISDNTATDALLHTLGREKVEALLPALGIADPSRTRPLLSTREATAIKLSRFPAIAEAWAAADEKGRRALLPRVERLPDDALDLTRYATTPRLIETAEWFANAEDMVRTMDWLRRNAGEEVLKILAINPGLGPAAAEKFAYMGFKGGSEPGVMALTFLLRTKRGGWLALSASWNDPKASLDELRFQALVNRAVALAAGL